MLTLCNSVHTLGWRQGGDPSYVEFILHVGGGVVLYLSSVKTDTAKKISIRASSSNRSNVKFLQLSESADNVDSPFRAVAGSFRPYIQRRLKG